MPLQHEPAPAPDRARDLRVGEWRVRPAEGLLERNGEAVRLRPRAMDVLTLLATRPGHAVSKEEIFAEVWAGNAVEDGALAHCISEIRTALGDTPRRPRYVETIPKRGYRLVALVVHGVNGLDPPEPLAVASAVPAPAALGRPLRRRSGPAVARLLAGLGGAGLLAWLLAAAIDRETPERTAAAVAGADRRPRVAVLGFSNLSGEPEARWLSTALSEMLTTEIAVSEVVKPIPGDWVARIKRELSIADSDRLEAEALAQLRAGLGVDYVVVGSYLLAPGDGSGEIRIDLRIQDQRSGEIVAAVVESGTVGELADLVLLAGLRLRRALGDGERLANQGGAAAGRRPASPTAARLYHQGLLHLRRLEAAAAIEPLERSAAEEPGAPEVHVALAEAWSLLGHDSRAAEAAERALALAGTLPRESQLWVEARCHALAARWDEAVERLGALWVLDPVNLDYGLELARAQLSSGRLEEALATIAAVEERRGSDVPDPRIELVAAEAAAKSGEFARSVAEAGAARELAEEVAAPLVTGQALLIEASGLHALGRVEEAEAALEQARSLFSAVGDRKSEASAAVSLAGWLLSRRATERSAAVSRQALATFREIGHRAGEADALRHLGQSVWAGGNAEEGERMLLEALAIYREIGNRPGEAAALSNLAIAVARFGGSSTWGPDHPPCSLFEQALAIHRELNKRDGIARAVSNLGRCALLAGDIATATDALAETAAAFRELDTPRSLATALFNLAYAQSQAGDPAAAASFEEAAGLFRRLDDPGMLGAALAGLGSARMMAADLRAAERQLEESLRIRRETGEALGIAYSLCSLARLRLLQGEPEQAERLAREAVSLAGAQPHANDYAGDARVELAFVLFETGQPDAARALVDAELPRLLDPEVPIGVNVLGARVTLARVLGATGDAERARALLEGVIARTERKGMEKLRLQAELARLEIDRGSGFDEPARDRLQAIAEQSRRRGMVLLAREAEALLAAGGSAGGGSTARAVASAPVPGSREAGK